MPQRAMYRRLVNNQLQELQECTLACRLRANEYSDIAEPDVCIDHRTNVSGPNPINHVENSPEALNSIFNRVESDISISSTSPLHQMAGCITNRWS